MKSTTNKPGMTVGLDGKRAVFNNTGLGNYSRYMVNIMSMAFPSVRFRLYTPSQCDNPRLEPLLARDNVELSVPDLHFNIAPVRAFWRTVDMPLQLKNDDVSVYHGLSNELPLTIGGICPSVVTIHDIIYRRVKADYTAIDRRLYDFKYGRSARIATRIIAISECTKNDIVNDYDIDPAKIDVIYQGVDPIFSLPVDTVARQAVRSRYSLPDRFILAVGTVQPRKNQLLALRGLAGLPDDVKLVVVGAAKGKYAEEFAREAARTGLSDRVIHLEVPFNDLPAVYSCAALSSYTSRYEGFGLPVVESLSCGTPVIACTGSCLEEAGGPGAVYVDPDDVEGWRAAALHLLEDGIFRDKTVRLGRRHIKQFSAETFAKSTMACYNKAIIDQLS